MIESAARKLAMELVGHRDAINRELSRNGVRFGIYQNGTYHDRLFPYDPIPRIIESDEFDDKAPLAKLANYLMPLQGTARAAMLRRRIALAGWAAAAAGIWRARRQAWRAA